MSAPLGMRSSRAPDRREPGRSRRDGGRAEIAAQYLSKGSRIGVTGRLESREWESDGQKRYGVEIISDQLDFLTPKSDGADPSEEPVPAGVGAEEDGEPEF